jgi:hypothetical protein
MQLQGQWKHFPLLSGGRGLLEGEASYRFSDPDQDRIQEEMQEAEHEASASDPWAPDEPMWIDVQHKSIWIFKQTRDVLGHRAGNLTVEAHAQAMRALRTDARTPRVQWVSTVPEWNIWQGRARRARDEAVPGVMRALQALSQVQLPSNPNLIGWRTVAFEGTRAGMQGVGVVATAAVPNVDITEFVPSVGSQVHFTRHTLRTRWPAYVDFTQYTIPD